MLHSMVFQPVVLIKMNRSMRMVTGGYAGTGYWSPWYLVLGPLVPGSGWREGGTEHISKT